MDIILPEVRLSYPDLWRPGAPPKDKPNEPGKYGCHGIFAPGSEAYKRATAAVIQVAQQKFGPHWQAVLESLAKDKKCLRNGNLNLASDGKVRDGYADHFYIVAKNKLAPIVIGRGGAQDVLTEQSGKPYGGCYVNLKVDIYAMDKPGFGKSINASLLAVQFVRDGESFGGARPNADGFEAFDDEPFGDQPADTASAAALFG